VDIVVRRLGEIVIREGWIELSAFAIDALVHGALECRLGPTPIPVPKSGVMLLAKIVPKGVGMDRPPA
jgi:hypothetical protein